jgi:hypothetical protein
MAKLGDYLPEVPQLVNQMTEFNENLNLLQLMKASSETSSAPTLGLDHVVNTWVRHQMAYRQQLVMDLQTITYSVAEIRSPLGHITSEVFRRGVKILPKVENPSMDEKKRLEELILDCNIFDQTLEEVFRQFHYDVNSIDDGFIYLVKEYTSDEGNKITSRVKEIRRLNPALVEFDLDTAGLPKNAHFLCPIHREDVGEKPGICKASGCTHRLWPAMYKYYHRNQHVYLFDGEVIHVSKFSPSETYGWSPILTIFEKALTLIGMDKNIYRYFFERKMPASMVMVTTDDPESLRRERAHIAAQTRIDPNYIPMVAVSSRNNRGRVDMVRLFHTLQEMDYLPVRQEIRERVAAMWGVTPAWQGTPDAFGGLSTQTQQLVVMGRVVEADQRLFHEKVIPLLMDALSITDWVIQLEQPEEKAEATRISFAQQRAQIANQFLQMGFDVKLKQSDVSIDEAEFLIAGDPVPSARMQGEQTAMALEQQKDQMEQMKLQQEQMAEGGEEGGEEMEKALNIDEETIKTAVEKAFTPDFHAKGPDKERDIDEWAKKREKKAEDRAYGFKDLGGNPKNYQKSWIEDLTDQGFSSPIIKSVTEDGSQMWFSQNNIDYVASLSPSGVVNVEKASFTPTTPSVSYNPTGSNTRKDKEDDEED